MSSYYLKIYLKQILYMKLQEKEYQLTPSILHNRNSWPNIDLYYLNLEEL